MDNGAPSGKELECVGGGELNRLEPSWAQHSAKNPLESSRERKEKAPKMFVAGARTHAPDVGVDIRRRPERRLSSSSLPLFSLSLSLFIPIHREKKRENKQKAPTTFLSSHTVDPTIKDRKLVRRCRRRLFIYRLRKKRKKLPNELTRKGKSKWNS